MSWAMAALIVVVITLILGYLAYYFFFVVKRPQFDCRHSPWREFLQLNLPILGKRYWPTPWCLDGRFQTILGSYLRLTLRDINYKREILNLKDGGILSLDWVKEPDRPNQLILILLPGLTGSSQCEYMKGFVNNLKDLDVCPVMFNHRGMGNTPLKTSRVYCGANSEDFEEALHHINSRYPEAPVIASGVSLGGMILSNYVVTKGVDVPDYLIAVLVFSIPWNLAMTTESIERPFLNRYINKKITQNLKVLFKKMRSQLELDGASWNYEQLMKSKTIREFDNRFTAPNFGFRDVDDYYDCASLHDKFHKIRIPFLCLTAADDLFQPIKGIPVNEINNSSHVALVATSRGGHIGFLEGLIPYRTLFSDRFLYQFIKGAISNIKLFKDIRQEANGYAEAKPEQISHSTINENFNEL